MIVDMSKFGTALITRVSGRAAYDFVASESNDFSIPVVFDFSEVDTVTNSFADELFGRMAFEFGMEKTRSVTSFLNVKPLSARIIRRAMDTRNLQRSTVSA